MGNKYLSKEGAMLQKKIRNIIWSIGGSLSSITLVVGIIMMAIDSLPVLGLFVILGIIPMELLLSYLATQCITVETEYVESGYTTDVRSNLSIVKGDENKRVVQREIEFTKIEPIRHLEIVNTDNKNFSRKREIINKKK